VESPTCWQGVKVKRLRWCEEEGTNQIQISLRSLLGVASRHSWLSVSGVQRKLGFGCMQKRGWKDGAEIRDQDLANCAAAVNSGEPNPGTGWFSELCLLQV